MEWNTPGAHRWRFCRLGGFDQVRLETGEDIRHLAELDQKLWAALSCPVTGLEFDTQTLALLDSDGDGRVRVQEVLAAADWTCAVLADPDSLLVGSAELPLAAIDAGHPEGRRLLASARQLLAYRGKPEADSVSMADVTDTASLLHESVLNGDGIVPLHAAGEENTARLIEEILACMGSDEDRSGKPGVSRERIEAFFEAARLYVQWWDRATGDGAILPFGDATHAAVRSYAALQGKIDDYFIRCGLAAYDPQAETPLNPSPATYETLAAQDLHGASAELARIPLARIRAGRALPLTNGVNPAWAAAIGEFARLIVTPLFGQAEHLDEDQWQRIKATFAPYEAWQAEKAGAEVEALGLARIREILRGPDREQLEQLLERDLRLAEQVAGIDKVVRLVHLHRDLYRLLNNFVSFRDFYAQGSTAIFQAGTLYLDGRACELCVRVENIETHSQLALLSRTYLAYCDCRRRGSSEQMLIAAAFTGGDADNLMVGRNGVFYDRKGCDWDATIVKIIDHPISVSQAFWAPYKRIARMIGEQIEKFAAAKVKEMDSSASTGIANAGAKATTVAAVPPAAPAPFDVGKFAGIFAAIGLALGAIGTAVATVIGGFLALPLWEMPLAVAGIVLAISGPSMLIAYLKLRQRNLGPILDANGWAVNARAAINIPFGSTLTKMAELPKGAERTLSDPFAEKKTPWKRWLILLALLTALGLAWQHGFIQQIGRQLKPLFTTQMDKAEGQAVPPQTSAPASDKPAPPPAK
ncbi:phage holin family protein [Desulfobulbus elongatus]|uniref:phage holin family protein n=1 Tax=Desulfobulbus elongatus TaxID=53332 RepID=UPI0004892963|nr:phage holin family protein [Desulfobulbus elongatus]